MIHFFIVILLHNLKKIINSNVSLIKFMCMKKLTFHLMLVTLLTMLGGGDVKAQDWAMPEFPESMAPSNGLKCVLYHAHTEMVLGNGKISAPWASSTILKENGNGLVYELVENSDATWSLKNTADGKYTFTPFAEGDRPYCYIDMAGDGQGDRKFMIADLEDGTYSLAFTNTELAPKGTYFGTNGDTYDVICNANPDEGGLIAWKFLSADAIAAYNAKISLYEQLEIASEYESIDLTPYVTVLNDPEATLEAVNNAIFSVKVAIMEAELLSGDYEPTPEEPLDVTSQFIVNPSFDGSVDGWQNIGGMTPSPSGASYGNDESSITDFCEKWTWDPQLNNEYGIYQTLSLVPGFYRLEADAIATRQADQSVRVNGVTIYVKNEVTHVVEVATANNSPKHYSIEFLVDGTVPTEIGFHCDKTTEANWICVDNWQLLYMGKVDFSATYIELRNLVNTVSAIYPQDQFEWLAAQTAVKDAYKKALDAATETLENKSASDDMYATAVANLKTAYEALNASKSIYDKLTQIRNNFSRLSEALVEFNIDDENNMEDPLISAAIEIDDLISEAVCGQEELDIYTTKYNVYDQMYKVFEYAAAQKNANAEDDVLCGMIEAKEAELRIIWCEGIFETVEQVAEFKNEMATMIAQYQNTAIKPNSDLTSLLLNPNFDENADGWDRNGFDNPGYSYSEVEYFQKNFNMSQTLKAMPKGRYTLTAQAFQRGSSAAVLYANENEMQVADVWSPQSTVAYFPGEDNWIYDSYDSSTGYFSPNSMEGARQWFDALDENGTPLYTHTLEFFLTEQEVTDLTIGIRSDNNTNWCLFDNFTLYYHGNSAKDYADGINKLINELDQMMDEGYPTAKLVATAEAAKKQANDAINSNDAEGCIASLSVLQTAIAEAKVTLPLTQVLADKYGYITEYRMEEVTSSTKEAYSAYLSTVADALNNKTIADDEAVQPIIDEMETKYTECVQADAKDASEANPFDMTVAIVNPTYECVYAADDEVAGSEFNSFGWEGDKPNCNEYSAEYFNVNWTKGVEIHQTIKGLAPGYYKLRVLGYNRQGFGNEEAHIDNLVSYAELYAGNYSTTLCDVLDGKTEESIIPEEEGQNESKVEIDGVTYYYPGNMPSSRVYFDEGKYQNMLVFKIEEGQKEITFGIKKETFTPEWDSLMFDDWTLEYVGTSEPAEQSTAVDNVFGAEISKVIFNLNGVKSNKLNKGVNIVKKTDSNGRVIVSKVLVK